jgi:hypothetical protein
MTDRAPTSLAACAEAFETLGVSPDVSPRELKRAYRRAAARHAPDRDPDGFRRVRAAYELLSRPQDAWDALLSSEARVPPPRLAPLPRMELAHALPLSALRDAVAHVSAEALLGGAGGE